MDTSEKQVVTKRKLRSTLESARQALDLRFASAYDRKGLLLRVAVDLLTANVGLLLGHVGTVVFYIATKDHIQRNWIISTFTSDWLGSVPLFTAVCLLAYAVSGLYSSAPGFRPLHKFWMVFRAVSLAFLLHMALMYFLRARLPRSAILFGWVFLMIFMVSVRVGRSLFFRRYRVEPRRGPRSGKIDHVLVIGGAGYIGSVLVRMLLEAGYHVRVLDKFLFGEDSIRDLYNRPDFEVIKGDFRHVETVIRALRGMDAVIHLGAIVGDPACALDDDVTVDVNTTAVRMIREACRGYGIYRFLFASTCSVYGAQEGVIDERSELAPVSLYAKSKIDAERAIMELAGKDFEPTILRLATVFGLSHRMRFDLVVNLLTARAVTEGKITILNGHQWRPFIHVSDVARAFTACLQAPSSLVAGRIYNVGDNRLDCTLAQLGEIVSRIVPGTEVSREQELADARSYRVDFSKIADEVGFECLTMLERGIEETCRELKAGRFPSYKDPIYSNVATLQNAGADVLADALRSETD